MIDPAARRNVESPVRIEPREQGEASACCEKREQLPLEDRFALPPIAGCLDSIAAPNEGASPRLPGRQYLAKNPHGVLSAALLLKDHERIMSSVKVICDAIRKRALLEFLYNNRLRIVAPYCCGVSARGADVLRAIQVRGESASGGLGFGKLWSIDQITGLRVLDEAFTPDDPDYNPGDRAMIKIHCGIQVKKP